MIQIVQFLIWPRSEIQLLANDFSRLLRRAAGTAVNCFDRLLSIEHHEYSGISDETLRKGLAHDLGYIQGLVRAKYDD